MSNNLTIQGVVGTQPEVYEAHTQFILQTEEQRYCVIRFEPKWQKRDVLFIRAGQTVSVTGKKDNDSEDIILALRIRIIGHSDLPHKEEIEYDTEAIRQANPRNRTI